MKKNSIKYVLAAVAAVAATACANAVDIVSPTQVLYTFDTGPVNASWAGAAWTPGPVGWAGGGALQSTSATAGYQNWTPNQNYTWTDNSQADMALIAADPGAHLSFDILIAGSSFTPGVSDWYNVSVAANSLNGWHQFGGVLGAGPWHDMNDNALHVTHLDYSFSQLGWTPTSAWFQLNFAANSGTSPVGFYIDNLDAYIVPEPTTLALAGLGAAALLIFRRK